MKIARGEVIWTAFFTVSRAPQPALSPTPSITVKDPVSGNWCVKGGPAKIWSPVPSPKFQIYRVLDEPRAEGVEWSVNVMVLLTQPPGGEVKLTVGPVTVKSTGFDVYRQPF